VKAVDVAPLDRMIRERAQTEVSGTDRCDCSRTSVRDNARVSNNLLITYDRRTKRRFQGSARFQSWVNSPDFPPLLCVTRRLSILIDRSTALHMS
jgi:hypothetical protein